MSRMGICWSEPPPPVKAAPVVSSPMYPCKGCGSWQKQSTLDYCETCLQKNAMAYIAPSAPPYQQQYPQYTYAVRYPPQQTYPQQTQYQQYQQYSQYPPQQRQMGTGTAIATGFVVGALMEDILDPSE